MKLLEILVLASCIATPFLYGSGQAGGTQEDCVARNADGWPLPWLGMKYSVSKRSVLLHNGKPTDMNKQLLTFPREISISVPGCGGASRLLRTNSVARIDFEGHVFAYLVNGTAIYRDEKGHDRALGAIKWATWYDEDGDGRFRKILWSPTNPPVVPAWVHRGSEAPK